MINSYTRSYLTILILFSFFITSAAQEKDSFGLFEDEDIIKLRLSFDIGTFITEKPEDDYLEADITIYLDEQDSIHENIRVAARGNYRRRNCDFPPVMLNFKGVETGYTDIDKLSKVKLVSHCKPLDKFRLYVLREYMAYKIYNIITDYSFRVRLLDIDYYDIDSDTLYARRLGFILEPVNNLEDRFDKKEIEDIEVPVESVNNENLLRLSLFQYLIANSDWFVPTIHNLKIFGDEDIMTDLVAVPYDFDYTGWVNTDYAVPREELGLEEIRDRAFLGPCFSENEYREALNYYSELEEKIIDTIKDFKYLKGWERRDLIRYVRSFYKLYKNDELLDICMEPCDN